MHFTPRLQQLITALRVLPGVGPKSAQRMAFHLLARNPDGGAQLAQVLADALTHIHHCQQCRMFSEAPVCDLCASHKRDAQSLCVVETPSDLMAIEQSAQFSGRYFVLHGHLSPLQGMGAEQLGLAQLAKLLQTGGWQELIIATNPTVEGEATAHYISELARDHVATITRIAHGVPMGGELEFIDGSTLARALSGRRAM